MKSNLKMRQNVPEQDVTRARTRALSRQEKHQQNCDMQCALVDGLIDGVELRKLLHSQCKTFLFAPSRPKKPPTKNYFYFSFPVFLVLEKIMIAIARRPCNA